MSFHTKINFLTFVLLLCVSHITYGSNLQDNLLVPNNSDSMLRADDGELVVARCRASDFVEVDDPNPTIVITPSFPYSPRCLKVKVGAKVTVEASVLHPLTAMPPLFDNPAPNPFADTPRATKSQTREMLAPGYFGYYCNYHGLPNGTGMTGVILVMSNSLD